ncbi:MAG: DUF2079 domain-containing protein [Myxococcales bacterium]|nr:DUF2079 domain-containing protein [Myxococcales bacterium]
MTSADDREPAPPAEGPAEREAVDAESDGVSPVSSAATTSTEAVASAEGGAASLAATPSPDDESKAASPPDGSSSAPIPEPEKGYAGPGHRLAVIARSLSLSALLAAAVALWVVFAFGKAWVPPFLEKNLLGMPERMLMIKTTLIALGVGTAIGGALLVAAWRKKWGINAVERVLWFLSPLLLLPLFPQVFRAKPWVNRQDVLVVLVLALALVAEVLAVQSLRSIPVRVTRALEWVRQRVPAFLKQHGPLLIVGAAVVAYVAFMSFYNIRWHHKLRTHNFDLAIDNNLIFSAMRGAHMQSTVSFGDKASQYLAAHAKLGQYVIMPVYALYPKPETLIVIQSALLGMGALPLFGIARRRVSPWMAVALALAYLAYYPLHSANFTESKYLSLSGFFVLSTYWAVERKKWWLFAPAYLCASLMREDVPIGLAVGGAFLLLSGYRPKIGALMAVVSSIWFVILRFVIMDNAGSWWFPDMYKGLYSPGQTGFGSVIKTLLTNPLFVLNEVLEKDKLLYVLHLLVPVALLPLRRWYLWAALIPGTVLTLLATDYKPLIGFSFQYAMHWVPYVFLAATLALGSMLAEGEQGRLRARAVIGALALASATLSYNYGAFARRADSVKGGYFAIDFGYSDDERARYAALLRVIAAIPADASVVATENIGPHVSSRRYMYAMRRGIYDCEYMLAARNELDFEQTRQLFTDAVKTGKYGVVGRENDFVLLRKGHDAKDNAKLIQDWSL